MSKEELKRMPKCFLVDIPEEAFNIDYAELYGVKSGETDFSGAIQRSLDKGVQYLSDEFMKALEAIRMERRKNRKL